MPMIIYGPDSEPYNAYSAVVQAPGAAGSGGPVAQRGVHPLGQQLVTADGRKFRFMLNGASTLTIGNVIGNAAIISTDRDLTAAAGLVGDRSVTFTHGAATTAINYFSEGFAVISVTPGLADTYRIANHEALGSGTSGVVNFAAGHALRRVLSTSSKVDLVANPYASMVVVAATILQTPLGVAVSALTAGQFGWVQSAGVCGVICTGTMTVGSPAVMLLSGGTAGTPAPAAAATNPVVGRVLVVAATGAASTLFLTMDT
jgi:hypothetical protein